MNAQSHFQCVGTISTDHRTRRRRRRMENWFITYSLIHRGALVERQNVARLGSLPVGEHCFLSVEYLTAPGRDQQKNIAFHSIIRQWSAFFSLNVLLREIFRKGHGSRILAACLASKRENNRQCQECRESTTRGQRALIGGLNGDVTLTLFGSRGDRRRRLGRSGRGTGGSAASGPCRRATKHRKTQSPVRAIE